MRENKVCSHCDATVIEDFYSSCEPRKKLLGLAFYDIIASCSMLFYFGFAGFMAYFIIIYSN